MEWRNNTITAVRIALEPDAAESKNQNTYYCVDAVAKLVDRRKFECTSGITTFGCCSGEREEEGRRLSIEGVDSGVWGFAVRKFPSWSCNGTRAALMMS
jgi:hypothetical protein